MDHMGSVNEFLHQKLAPYVSVFWFSLSTYLLPLLGFLNTYLFFRLRRDDSCLNYNSSSLALNSEESNKIDYNYVKADPDKESKEDYIDYRDSETDGLFDQNETTQLCFNFKFPTFEEFSTSMRDNGDFVSSEAMPSISTNKYEFMSKKSFSSFIEELEPINFKVEEVNTEINGVLLEMEILMIKKSYCQTRIFIHFIWKTRFMKKHMRSRLMVRVGKKKMRKKIQCRWQERREKQLKVCMFLMKRRDLHLWILIWCRMVRVMICIRL